MVYKSYIFLIMLTIAGPVPCENWSRINEIIYREKEHVTTSCILNRNDMVYSSFAHYFINEDSVSTVEEFDSVLDILKIVGCCKNKYGGVILDGKVYSIFIDLLGTIENEDVSHQLLEYVYNNGSNDLFFKYEEKIKDIAFKHIDTWQLSALILTKCTLTKSQKRLVEDKLKVYYKDKLPYYVNIRLGDTNSENKLIREYEKEDDFSRLKVLIEQLQLAGTNKCELALVKSLGAKSQEKHTDRYGYSIRYFIIKALAKLKPEERLLNNGLHEIKSKISDDISFEKKRYSTLVIPYFKKIYKWIYSTYGLRIEQLEEADFLYSYTATEIWGD